MDKYKKYLSDKKYRDSHKEEIRIKKQQYNILNKEKISERRKKYYNDNKSSILQKVRSYKKSNRKKIVEYNIKYERTRRKIDFLFRIKKSLRLRIRDTLKGRNKSKKTLELLGCSLEFLKTHLESQFKSGMSWENYGFKGWHIDHIKPCSLFDLSKPEEQEKCFHYTNLQPLWAEENLSKSNKY